MQLFHFHHIKHSKPVNEAFFKRIFKRVFQTPYDLFVLCHKLWFMCVIWPYSDCFAKPSVCLQKTGYTPAVLKCQCTEFTSRVSAFFVVSSIRALNVRQMKINLSWYVLSRYSILGGLQKYLPTTGIPAVSLVTWWDMQFLAQIEISLKTLEHLY